MERASLVGYLDDFLRRDQECAYVQCRGCRTVRWSYRQVAEAAFQFARELSARNLDKGDRVLLWAPNSAEWVAGFFGCALRGVIVVPIDDASTLDFAMRVYEQVSARLLLCSSEHLQPSIPALVLDRLAETLADLSPARPEAAAIESKDTLEIVFTSGTTAEPRGVVITHANVLANIAPLETEIHKYLKYERFVHPVRFLNLLPLSHVFGQFLGMFLPPLVGATVLFQDTLKPAEVMRTMRRERVSVLVAVPRMLQALKEKIERDLEDEGRAHKFHQELQFAESKHFLRRWWIFRRLHRQFGWKFWAFISGGAALDRDMEEFWRRLGYAVIQGYGLTETTSIISLNHPFHTGKGSIGKVLAGREVKLAADGEIMVRGGGVAGGYWNGNRLRAVTSEEEWYATGDIGKLDREGNLYFKGRKKDVIVTPAGLNIYPEDLEAALRRQPEVKQCVVIALPRDGNAEPCAVVILREATDPQEVVKRANHLLADYQRMRNWFVWPGQDFPRTSTQKPRTNVIQQIVLSQLGEKENRRMASGLLTELIAGITGKAGELRPHADLENDLNLSSLDRMELLSALEDRYQLDLSETQFAAVKTVADLERMLHGQIPARVEYHYPRGAQRWPVRWTRLFTHYVLLRPAVFILGWPRVSGRENLRDERGPVLVVCNHIGDLDVGFVLTALPAHLRHKLATAAGGEALQKLRTPPSTRGMFGRIYDRVKWVLGVSLLNLFPLPREAGFRQSFAYAGELVDRGCSVLVFPEGRHTTDGKMLPFRAGIGLLATNLRIPVVPMRIDGLFELKQAGKKFARPHSVTVRIGKPVSVDQGSDPAEIARALQKLVAEL